MLQIIPLGDDVFRLEERGGRVVGWVRGLTIRIGTFATHEEAIDAAVLGDGVLDSHLSARAVRPTVAAAGADMVRAVGAARAGSHTTADARARARLHPETRLVHDGAYEWIVVARRPVARLVRPPVQTRGVAVRDATTLASEVSVGQAAPAQRCMDFALEFIAPESVAPPLRLTLARALHSAFTRTRTLSTHPPQTTDAESARAPDPRVPPPAA